MLMTVEEQGFQDGDGGEVLAVGRVQDGEVDGECVSALDRTVPEDDLTKEDRLPECSFGMIVRRGHAVYIEKCEQTMIIALGIEEAQPKTLGRRVRDGLGTEDMQLGVEVGDAGLGGAEGA